MATAMPFGILREVSDELDRAPGLEQDNTVGTLCKLALRRLDRGRLGQV
jgi:hypothetical protein